MVGKLESRHQVQHTTMIIGTETIHVSRIGSGDHHVLLAPGGMGSYSVHLNHQMLNLDHEKFTVLSIDPPAFGRNRPSPDYVISAEYFEDYCDVFAEILKRLSIQEYSLVGFCDGGVSSIIQAAKYPNSVKKLVLIGSHSYIMKWEMELMKVLTDTDKLSDRMKQAYLTLYTLEDFVYYFKLYSRRYQMAYELKNGEVCSDRLKDIRCPTLILHGGLDPLVDASHGQFMADRIRNSRLHMYPLGKHFITLSDADDVTRRIQDFLLEEK